jgi:PAS domain-containing protein
MGFVVRIVAVVALAWLTALPALAGDVDDMYKASAAAYKAGDFEKALKLLEKACSILPDDRCDYNAGRIHEKLGRPKEAAARYRNAMAKAVSEEVREKAEERLRAILPSLPGRIGVRTEVAGARVSIDGKAAGTTPFSPVEVAPGEHEVLLTHPDHDDTSARVKVAPDQEVVVTLTPTRSLGTVVVNADVERGTLVVDGGERRETGFPARVMLPVGVHRVAVSAERGEGDTAVTVRKGEPVQVTVTLRAPAVAAPVVASKPAAPERAPETAIAAGATGVQRPWWGWVTLGGGVAVLVTGGIMTWLAEKDRSDVSSAIDAIKANPGAAPGMTMADAAALQASADDKATASYVLYGIGGAAAVAGAVILAVGLPAPATAGVAPVAGGGAMLTINASF